MLENKQQAVQLRTMKKPNVRKLITKLILSHRRICVTYKHAKADMYKAIVLLHINNFFKVSM